MQQQAIAVDQLPPSAIIEQRPRRNSKRKAKPVSLRVSKKMTIEEMNKRQKRLLSIVARTLVEHGNLDARKAAVVALAKEAKVNNAQLKEFVEIAREKHPEINQVMRIIKKIRTLKAAGKTPNMALFNHLLPEAKLAGKNDFWLSEKLGYVPANLEQQLLAAEKQNAKKSIFGMIKS